MSLKDTFLKLAQESHSQIRDWRRHLHANPELSYEEYETAAFVENQLKSLGLNPQRIGNTGVTAIIEGKEAGNKVFALRADMDALPIFEANEVPYKSTKPGVMHACGHDVHTASLLGAARILTETKNRWNGTVKLIFQPAEEKTPGGASILIKEGILKNPEVTGIAGQHVMPFLPAGKLGIRSGTYMASADEIYVTVKGKGGHGAMPETFLDPVMVSAQMLVALQQVVSRFANPKIPSVLSFGKVIAQGATNVIPNEVYLEGTFRTLDEKWRFEAHKRMKAIAQGIADGFGATIDFRIEVGYPVLVNEPELTARTKQYLTEVAGPENIVDLDLWMAAEDFSYYTHQVPGCFYRLGTRNEAKGITSGVHTPTFDIEEGALVFGAAIPAWIAIRELGNGA